jgi:hypothetical protein
MDGREHDRTKEIRAAWGSIYHHQPMFNEPKPEHNYLTLRIEIGNIERFPDYEVIWTVPIMERLRHP